MGVFLNTEQTFKSNLAIKEGSGCWEWQRSKTQGYGETSYHGRKVKAHRLAAHFWLGFSLSSKLFVCHHCDNPSCCNPKHLFIGTNTDNIRDGMTKGRSRFGGRPLGVHDATCKNGHPRVDVYINRDGFYSCRICRRNRRSKTHRGNICKRGHPLSGENLYWDKIGRHCRTCRNLAIKQWHAKHAKT